MEYAVDDELQPEGSSDSDPADVFTLLLVSQNDNPAS
jgi:hypothetical protein